MAKRDFTLEIKYVSDRDGYRVLDPANGTDPKKNPKVKGDDGVYWKAPQNNPASIVILPGSPFLLNGKKIDHHVIPIPAGGVSKDKITIDGKFGKGKYEYAALVETGKQEYTYVRGEASPPGVVL